jgi:hypothetical protein
MVKSAATHTLNHSDVGCRRVMAGMSLPAALLAVMGLALGLSESNAAAQVGPETSFTYQGELRDGSGPVNGFVDLRFELLDGPVNGSSLGAPLCADNVEVVGGRFTVTLDFGLAFQTARAFLGIAVRPETGLLCSDTTGFTTLTPAAQVTAAPLSNFALKSSDSMTLNGLAASDLQNLGGTTGTLPSQALSGIYGSTVQFTSQLNTFMGVGSGLTALNATHITSGVLDHARLPTDIARLNQPAFFTADVRAPSLLISGPLRVQPANGIGLEVSGNTITPNVLSLATESPDGVVISLTSHSASPNGMAIIYTGSGHPAGPRKLMFRDLGAAADRITITTEGRLGINSSSPTHLLEVGGNARINGPLTAQELIATGGVTSPRLTLSGPLTSTDTFTTTGAISTSGQVSGAILTSTTTSEAPLAVASGIKVDNLNADRLDGFSSESFARKESPNSFGVGNTFAGLTIAGDASVSSSLTATTITATAGISTQGEVAGRTLTSTATAGAPLTVASSGRVDNLNADFLDGFSSADFVRQAGTNVFSGQNSFTSQVTFTTVKANEYRLNTAVTRYKNISAVEFQPVNNTVAFTRGPGGIHPTQSGTTMEAAARFILPNNVDITGFQVVARDGSLASNIQVILLIAEEASLFGSASVPAGGLYATSGSTNAVLAQTVFLPQPLRYDDDARMYFVVITVPNTSAGATTDASLLAVRIRYTQNALTP